MFQVPKHSFSIPETVQMSRVWVPQAALQAEKERLSSLVMELEGTGTRIPALGITFPYWKLFFSSFGTWAKIVA
jgi:hypothetical protein